MQLFLIKRARTAPREKWAEFPPHMGETLTSEKQDHTPPRTQNIALATPQEPKEIVTRLAEAFQATVLCQRHQITSFFFCGIAFAAYSRLLNLLIKFNY